MKKFILFFVFILTGVISVSNSYAIECEIQKNQPNGNVSDDLLYLNYEDLHDRIRTPKAPENSSSYLKCDTSFGGNTICKDKTVIFTTKKAYIGKSVVGLKEVPANSIIQCETGANDKWVDKKLALSMCPNDDTKRYYVTDYAGAKVYCTRLDSHNGHFYCIGKAGTINSDICFKTEQESASVETPKEEPKPKAKQPEKKQKEEGRVVTIEASRKKKEEPKPAPAEEKKEEPAAAPAPTPAAASPAEPAPKTEPETPEDCEDYVSGVFYSWIRGGKQGTCPKSPKTDICNNTDLIKSAPSKPSDSTFKDWALRADNACEGKSESTAQPVAADNGDGAGSDDDTDWSALRADAEKIVKAHNDQVDILKQNK